MRLNHEGEVASVVISFLVFAVEGLQINCWSEALILSLLEVLANGLDRRGEAIGLWFERDEDCLACARVNFYSLLYLGVQDDTDLIGEEVKLQNKLLA